jgi:hypothetical protein
VEPEDALAGLLLTNREGAASTEVFEPWEARVLLSEP